MFIHAASTKDSMALLEFTFLKTTAWNITWFDSTFEIEVVYKPFNMLFGKESPTKKISWDTLPRKKQEEILKMKKFVEKLHN